MKKYFSFAFLLVSVLLFSCVKDANFGRQLLKQDGKWRAYVKYERFDKSDKLLETYYDTIMFTFLDKNKGNFYYQSKPNDIVNFTYDTGLSNEFTKRQPYIQFKNGPFSLMMIEKATKSYQLWKYNDWPLFSDTKKNITAELNKM